MRKGILYPRDIDTVTTMLEALAKDYGELAKGAYEKDYALYGYLLGYTDALKIGRALIEEATKDGDGLDRDEELTDLVQKIYAVTRFDGYVPSGSSSAADYVSNFQEGRWLGGRAAAMVLLLVDMKYYREGEDD